MKSFCKLYSGCPVFHSRIGEYGETENGFKKKGNENVNYGEKTLGD